MKEYKKLNNNIWLLYISYLINRINCYVMLFMYQSTIIVLMM